MLWLIRHGESMSNAGKPTASPSSIELTENGKRQATALAKKINDKPDLIIYSPYIRAFMTAKPMMDKFPDVPTKEMPVYEFTYLSPRTCRNTTAEQRRPRVLEYWKRNDPDYVDGDDAESFNDLLDRVKDLLAVAHNGRLVMVFTHEMFIRAVLAVMAAGISSNVNMSDVWQGKPIANTEIIKIP